MDVLRVKSAVGTDKSDSQSDLCCGCSKPDPKAGKSVIPDLSCGFLRHRFGAQGFVTSLLPLHHSAPWGYGRELVPFGKSCFLCSCSEGPGSPGCLWALSSICIPAVGIISGAQPEGAHAVPFPSWTSLGPVAFSFLFYCIVKRLPAGYRYVGVFSAAVCREQESLWSHLALATASSFSR